MIRAMIWHIYIFYSKVLVWHAKLKFKKNVSLWKVLLDGAPLLFRYIIELFVFDHLLVLNCDTTNCRFVIVTHIWRYVVFVCIIGRYTYITKACME